MHISTKKIATTELAKIVDTKHHEEIILDLRPVDSYNGWKYYNEYRSGHIKSAISFPLEWTHFEFEMPEILADKGIKKGKKLVLYSGNNEESEKMAFLLTKNGYDNIRIYENFIDQWTYSSNLPMEHLPLYKKLVPPLWLKNLIDKNETPEDVSDDYVICHAHYDHFEDYKKGHIPGAIPLNTLWLESPETWNRRSPEDLEKSLLANGISDQTTVILYGRFSHPDFNDPYPGKSAGQLAAFRCAAIMLYAGVKDIRILNGGLINWELSGYPLTKEIHAPNTKDHFGSKIPRCPNIMIDTEKAKEILGSKNGALVCVRSLPEYLGEQSGYHYIEKKGRIPGAVFGNCGTDAYHMENYRNPDHTMKSFHEVANNWALSEIVPEKHIAFYCGTGWRGSEAFMNAYFMNWPKISVYDGGWMEWSSDPNNPIEESLSC